VAKPLVNEATATITVDSEGTAPVSPSMLRVCSSASKAHSAIAVNDRPGHHREQRQSQDHRQPVAHAAAMPRVSHPGQNSQEAPRLPRSISGQLNQVADGRVNR
jgi:hypothetical protein